MKNNVIPRTFNRLVGKMVRDTNVDKKDDVIYIHKEEGKYLAFNTRTQKHAWCSVSMLRDRHVFELMSVE
ncbi:hypothetical protein IMZ31_19600 (plasmid) [Pontibacillus sp. ALD_SL1]|uniref:hypothetical protein n=1 Tax=Pontibacillus sp. ALD_SL1 TaxID=2777185 RepID=UPI001A9629CB|nr:hypothetical protein [Pontibacillus sp. ALD_SL1]QST02757.1 hypothetical protein IMZ31_19600 [Pontibacillus sp. ALD_SL1]